MCVLTRSSDVADLPPSNADIVHASMHDLLPVATELSPTGNLGREQVNQGAMRRDERAGADTSMCATSSSDGQNGSAKLSLRTRLRRRRRA